MSIDESELVIGDIFNYGPEGDWLCQIKYLGRSEVPEKLKWVVIKVFDSPGNPLTVGDRCHMVPNEYVFALSALEQLARVAE